jgi:hypothetical protein
MSDISLTGSDSGTGKQSEQTVRKPRILWGRVIGAVAIFVATLLGLGFAMPIAYELGHHVIEAWLKTCFTRAPFNQP